MKISCKRENLSRGLAIVGRMVKSRATLPVLSNILLSTDKGRLKLVSTDLEAAVSHWIGAKVDDEGAVTVPARTLVDYITACSDEKIDIQAAGSDISIKSDQHKASIKGISAEEFPIIPEVKGQNPLKIKAIILKKAIFSVSAAAALDETRPVLAGILMRAKGSEIKIVATDSYRLAEFSIKMSKSQSGFELLIPQRMANELARILPSDESEVEIAVGENQAEFNFAETQFVSRQIEGNFPDYEQIIPKELSYEFEASSDKFAEALKLASIFAREAGNNIKLIGEGGSVTISAASNQIGDAQASLKVSSKGTPLTVAFNVKYILDALSVMEAENVSVGLSGALSPGIITSSALAEFKYIIMPLRSE